MVSFNEVVAPTIYIVEAVRGFHTYVFLTQRSTEGYAEERRVFGKKISVDAEVAENAIWIYLISLERIFNVKF